MIRLINKDNARVGMVVDVYKKDGRIREEKYTITDIRPEYIYNNKIGYDFKFHYFSLVSMPERRLLSWDTVKDLICPIDVWDVVNKKYSIAFKNEFGYLENSGDSFDFQRWEWIQNKFDQGFIDPPLPDIPEVPEPWLVKEEKMDLINWSPLLQIPYNSCYCYTSVSEFDCIIKGVSIIGGSVSLRSPVTLLRGDKYRVDYNNGQAVIEIIKSVKQNPDDEKSLWWLKAGEQRSFLNTDFCTRNDLANYDNGGLVFKCQPYNQESQFGPIDNKWEAVK